MKLQTTKKQIRENFGAILSIGYCSADYLLQHVNPFAYSAGVYGWACDYYDFGGVCISTGYNPIGKSVIFEQLKQKFNHWSYCRKCVPSLGSACYKINKLNSNCGAKIEKVIQHRNGDITLCTNFGYLKFMNL